MLQSVREALSKRIELERSEGFNLAIDKTDISVPDNFLKPYREILPHIHERVYQGLGDKVRTDEALVEIFSSFIIRWGRSLDAFSDHHNTFLTELADRTVAEFNNVTKGGSSAITPRADRVPDVTKAGLAGEILKAVEQELRRNSETARTP
jgi:hypothetical protein